MRDIVIVVQLYSDTNDKKAKDILKQFTSHEDVLDAYLEIDGEQIDEE
jgi:hypothetical protein